MQEFIYGVAGAGGLGTVVLGIIMTLRSSFRGITEQWEQIFATQSDQILELRAEVRDLRQQALEDRVRLEAETAASKLAEKQCRDDYARLSWEVSDLRRQIERTKAPHPIEGEAGAQ